MGKSYTELVTPSEFISLKNRIKNEVKRRKNVGDVSSYGNSEYDYKVIPKKDSIIELEHINKISECVGAINDTNIKRVHQNGDFTTEIIVLDAEITKFESAKVSEGSSGCKSSCTGMCSTSCTGTCTSGCTGTCSGTCSGTCNSSCSGCSGCSGCSSSCSYSCGDWCQQTCGNNNCSGNCTSSSANSSDCGSMCTGGCKGSCAYGCTGSSNYN